MSFIKNIEQVDKFYVMSIGTRSTTNSENTGQSFRKLLVPKTVRDYSERQFCMCFKYDFSRLFILHAVFLQYR